MKKKIKSSHDACKAIVGMTQSYKKPVGSPDDYLIHNLRNIAIAGIKADDAIADAEDADLGRMIEKAEKEQGKFPFEELKLH